MDTRETTQPDKQITIEVPADRVAEFYAFYGRFLAAGQMGRRGRRGRHGHGPGHHGRCGHREEHASHREEPRAEAPAGPETTAV